ncbi:MAG: universal stress protein [Polyangiaceae bacterium]|nr:universal stress protein [Polyangiaceae bacterium]MCK6536868.1 universal stress protein [Polyangiaceae bacterium]
MINLRKILVPVDYSACSRAALEHAAMLAKSFNATIDLLYVWEAPAFIAPEAMVGAAGTTQTLAQLASDQAQAAMREFVAQARTDGIQIANTRVEQGDPSHTIVTVAERDGYDLVAMGTHGRSGFAHLLLGSVAEKVVRRSTRPVLTVRTGESES